MKNHLILFMLFLLIAACKSKHSDQTQTQDFFTINYESSLANKQKLNLSDFASKVSYVPLQTDSNCLLEGIPAFQFTKDYIFAGNKDHVLMFDSNGRFIRKIGNPGKGPHELDFVMGLTVMEKERLIAIKTLGTSQLIFFDFDGKFVKAEKVPGAFCIFPLQNDTLLAYDLCPVGYEDYFFRLTNYKNDTIDFVRNPFKWENNTGTIMMVFYGSFLPYYTFRNHSYFKSMHNDTVYTIAGGKIKPAYFIDLGKYRLPIEIRPENPSAKAAFEQVREISFYASAMETPGEIFITSNNYDDESPQNVLYHKATKEGILLVKDQDAPSGFINDLDNGPEFWPNGYVDEHKLYMSVSSLKIKELTESEQFKNKATNKGGRHFAELAAKIHEDDNPVIMIVEIK